VNPLATDLIRRMLQVDPYRRIRIHEIMTHPWVRSKVPLYARVPRCYALEKEDNFEIDEEVYGRVRKMGFANLTDANDERIKKSIKKRDDESFVITYELLKDQKERRVNVNDFLQSQYSCPNLIVTEIDNVLSPPPANARSDFQYGRRISKPVKILTEIIIQALRVLGIDFSIKSTRSATQTRNTA
jgi:serine/threonine protein kinase